MANLSIDIGNTKSKVALFENSKLLKVLVFEKLELSDLQKIIDEYHPKKSIISSVAHCNPTLLNWLSETTELFDFNNKLQLPLNNAYGSPQTLGPDRLAAALAAATLKPRNNVLAIVAGTCITYNLVNAENSFLGGAISPGLHMRLQAMHTFTAKLPLVKIEENFVDFLGTTTVDSLKAGAQQGAIAEMEGMIGKYNDAYPNLQVFLSGGDALYFDNNLKNSIFANCITLEPHLMLIGLNTVLNYQN